MLFGKRNVGVTLVLVVLLLLASCKPTGSIVVVESLDGKEVAINFLEWNKQQEYKLYLQKGDVLQFIINREMGKIGLNVMGRNGSEPYTGNDVESGVFTVTVSETDDYVIFITGEDATGQIRIKRASNRMK